MKPMKDMNDVGSILRKILIKSGMREEVIELDVIREFPKLFPGLISQTAKPISLKGGRLYLKVDGSVVRNELKLREREILRKIEKFLGTKAIDRILFI